MLARPEVPTRSPTAAAVARSTKMENQLDAPIGKDALEPEWDGVAAVGCIGEKPDALDERVERRRHAMLAILHWVLP
jgi:hypothetical protein